MNAQKIAQRLVSGALRMDSKEYDELEPEIRATVHALYQDHFTASEKEREEAARHKVAEENEVALAQASVAADEEVATEEDEEEPNAQ